jgi:hypothetical protein
MKFMRENCTNFAAIKPLKLNLSGGDVIDDRDGQTECVTPKSAEFEAFERYTTVSESGLSDEDNMWRVSENALCGSLWFEIGGD